MCLSMCKQKCFLMYRWRACFKYPCTHACKQVCRDVNDGMHASSVPVHMHTTKCVMILKVVCMHQVFLCTHTRTISLDVNDGMCNLSVYTCARARIAIQGILSVAKQTLYHAAFFQCNIHTFVLVSTISQLSVTWFHSDTSVGALQHSRSSMEE